MNAADLALTELTQQQMNQVVLTVVLPLLAAFLLPTISRISITLARYLGPVVLLFGLLLCVGLWSDMTNPFMVKIGGFEPPAGIVFYVDQLSLLFTGLVFLMALLLWPYGNEPSIREYSLTLLLVAGACGLALSGDLFNIYVFYELVSVASFGLVSSRVAPAAYAAAVRYVIISGFGSVLALTGIAVVYTHTGTLNLAHLAQLAPQQLSGASGITAFLLILLGIGVKAELFPVNTWVPEAYATARKRVSALLAGVISKLAVIVLVRLLVLVFNSDQALHIMLILGIIGVISGELAAWRAKDLSRMLAYSSIGQLSIIFVAFSIPGEAGLYAGIALSLHHLIVKPALFLLATSWGGSIKNLSGAARRSPLAAILFLLFTLSLIGVPPLPGFWAKLLTVTGLLSVQSSVYTLALIVMLLSTVIEANYLFRVILKLYEKSDARSVEIHSKLDVSSSAVLAGVLVLAVIFIAPLGQHIKSTAQQVADNNRYIATVFAGVEK